MKRIWIVLGILAGVIAIAGAGYLGLRSSAPEVPSAPETPETVTVERCDVEQSVTAPGSVTNFDEITIGMPVNGKLAEILVQPGDQVSAGDVLATLESDPVAIAQARLALSEAQKKLTSTTSERERYNHVTSNQQTIDVARANLTLAEQQYNEALSAYNSYSDLPADDPMRAMALIALDNARNQKHNAQDVLNTALSNNPSATDIALADARLALAQANLSKAQADLETLTSGVINAPFTGVVLKSDGQAHRFTQAATDLFTLHAPEAIEVKASVTEEDFPFVEIGQKVELYFDALPDVESSGVVTRIVPERLSGDRPLYQVYVRLDAVPVHLVDGMTADTAIQIAQRQQVLCLPRALVHASSGETATIKVWNGLTVEKREIKIGLRGDVYIEILSGLVEGEKVTSK